MNAAELYLKQFDTAPVGAWSAPGRVNLIGEHTDYSGGLVLPFAIDARAQVAIGPGATGATRVVSAQRPGRVATAPPGELVSARERTPVWARYLLGVLWALGEAGFEVPALDIALDSTVPAGAGLSSSAAVECAVALAVSEHLNLGIDRPALARIAQHAENDYVGMPCGLMDQMASAASVAGHALFFDAGSGSYEHIPFASDAAGLATLVIDTRAHHSLADGEYAKRRAETEQAAELIGVDLLSQVLLSNLDWALERITAAGAERAVSDTHVVVLQRRAHHVITENQRVRETVALLRAGYIEAIGEALAASHESLRDDFEVSCPELDLAAETAEEAGALGARMVGGGFGGSVIAIVPRPAVGTVSQAVTRAFAQASWRAPVIRSVTPAAGAHRDA